MPRSNHARFPLVLMAGASLIAFSHATLASEPDQILHSFGASGDGTEPTGVLAVSGENLYGVTIGRGTYNGGTLFSYNVATGSYSSLHSFSSISGGSASPSSVIAGNGNLYGTTTYGGSNGLGEIFDYNLTNHTYTTLYNFSSGGVGGTDPGCVPVLVGSNLYGTSSYGGTATGTGVLWQYNLSSESLTALHNFSGPYNAGTGGLDGSFPKAALTLAGSQIYGVTATGGVNNTGTIYEYDVSTGNYDVVRSFNAATGHNSNSTPAGGLVLDDGTIYGSLLPGGASYLYGYNLATGIETDLAAGEVSGSLALSGNQLYGMNASSDSVFSYDLGSGQLTDLHDFDGDIGDADMGTAASTSLTIDGSIAYGITNSGGANYAGALFSVAVPEPSIASGLLFSGFALMSRRRQRIGTYHKAAIHRIRT